MGQRRRVLPGLHPSHNLAHRPRECARDAAAKAAHRDQPHEEEAQTPRPGEATRRLAREREGSKGQCLRPLGSCGGQEGGGARGAAARPQRDLRAPADRDHRVRAGRHFQHCLVPTTVGALAGALAAGEGLLQQDSGVGLHVELWLHGDGSGKVAAI